MKLMRWTWLTDGQKHADARVIGFLPARRLAASLRTAGL